MPKRSASSRYEVYWGFATSRKTPLESRSVVIWVCLSKALFLLIPHGSAGVTIPSALASRGQASTLSNTPRPLPASSRNLRSKCPGPRKLPPNPRSPPAGGGLGRVRAASPDPRPHPELAEGRGDERNYLGGLSARVPSPRKLTRILPTGAAPVPFGLGGCEEKRLHCNRPSRPRRMGCGESNGPTHL